MKVLGKELMNVLFCWNLYRGGLKLFEWGMKSIHAFQNLKWKAEVSNS